MSKRIAFCADGTWDTSDKNTNVRKLFNALVTTPDQIAFYDDGVGADGDPVWKILGGAFGTGLWQKIKDGYTKIAHVYEAGDQIYLFGFSRGAYTARSLAGMIAVAGLPTAKFSQDVVENAFHAYRDRDDRQSWLEKLKDNDMFDAKIEMVGVWDTVGSLGIPSAFGGVDPVLYGFLDTSLHPDVIRACHALAIDEKRAQFPATLWTSTPGPGQTLEQVWFCGVHSDVGGGEPPDASNPTALSDIPLAWMMDKAAQAGLQFDPAVGQKFALPLDPEDALDTLHTSWTVLCGFPKARAIDANVVLANSVLVRCQHDSSYRPKNLSFTDGALSSQYGVAAVVEQPESLASAHSAGR